MKTKEIEKIELKEDGFMKKLNYIEISLQDKEDVKNAIAYNKQEQYIYKFIARNLINTECLLPFLYQGYKISPYKSDIFNNDCIVIYHE